MPLFDKEIDDARIYKILEEHLGDFKKYVDSIATFLDWDVKQEA